MSSPYSHSDIFPFIVSIKCTYLLALILYLCCILFFKHPLKWFHKFLFCRYTSEVAVSSVYRQFLTVLLFIDFHQTQSSQINATYIPMVTRTYIPIHNIHPLFLANLYFLNYNASGSFHNTHMESSYKESDLHPTHS